MIPLYTSPNWPAPSFWISWIDARDISHESLVLNDKSEVNGAGLGHGKDNLQERPWELSQ